MKSSKNSSAFESRFASAIDSTLSCHDRVIFKGYLPLWGQQRLNSFVDHVLRIRRMDFIPQLESLSQQLVDHAKDLAASKDAPYEYRQGNFEKEKFVDHVDRARQHPEGLLAVLCVQETCATVKLRPAKGKPELYYARRPQRVLYFYYNDLDFGRIYIRLQTWFPYPVQIYVNGHSWLAQQMARLQLGFVQQDNAFTELDRPDRAQKLADRFPRLAWPRILDKWVRPLMPLLKHPWFKRMWYDWKIHQCEYSTDVLFRSRTDLAQLFPQLLNHALLFFSAEDVFTFLSRRFHRRFDGEVITDCKKNRWPGARIKHGISGNWIKMYDKFGQILRIETVINNPKEFRTLRWGTKKGERLWAWYPMAKGIKNFWRYTEIAQLANRRYLDALAKVVDTTDSLAVLEKACLPVQHGPRRRRGLNPVHTQDQALFHAVMRGEHIVNGFRNRQILRQLFTTTTKDRKERKRRSAHVTRRLQLLRAHGLIKKAPRATLYYVTEKGFVLMGAAISIKNNEIPNIMKSIRALAG